MLAIERPRRTRRVPLTYWEEFVQTDPWYKKKLLEDVPQEEMHAALYDEHFSEDEESEEEECDDAVQEEEADTDYLPKMEISDEESEPSDASEEGNTGSDSSYSDDDAATEESILGTSEGESGSESAGGEGARSAVG